MSRALRSHPQTDWVTPDRVVALVRLRWGRRQWKTIIAQIGALPGPQPDPDAVQWYCRRHNVRSADGVEKARRAARMREAKAAKARCAPVVLEIIDSCPDVITLDTAMNEFTPDVVVCGFDDVASWAGSNGLVFRSWDDLPGVNLKREMMGLLRVARCFGRR